MGFDPLALAGGLPMAVYSEDFYAYQRGGSRRSAEVVLAIVLDLLKPASIIDVGCGVGTWLAVARGLGVRSLLGLEGEWVRYVAKDVDELDITFCDLEAPLKVPQRFDLALCMEVAEHLTEGRADSFVRDLCAMSDVILFGAAVPGQGGCDHINEQWQSYWSERFASLGYRPYDVVRPKVWTDPRVEHWYRQNSLLYVNDAAKHLVNGYPECTMISMMHPETYDFHHPYRLRRLLREFPYALKRAALNRLNPKAAR
jgi:SAM-dependent methyltransferase